MSRSSPNVSLLTVLMGALLCACSKQPPREAEPTVASSAQVVRMTAGRSVSNFVADVPAYDQNGECQTRTIPGLGRQVGLLFREGSTVRRSIWLTYDASGAVANYSELRGDMMRKVAGPDGGPPKAGEPIHVVPPAGRQTSIDINLESGWGMATNDGGGRPPLRVAGKSATMLYAANLGSPATMIELIRTRCN